VHDLETVAMLLESLMLIRGIGFAGLAEMFAVVEEKTPKPSPLAGEGRVRGSDEAFKGPYLNTACYSRPARA
jgi:hypothetical protein